MQTLVADAAAAGRAAVDPALLAEQARAYRSAALVGIARPRPGLAG